MISLLSIMSGGGNQVVVDPSRQWLIDNARAFWDFNYNGEINEVPDLTGNEYDLTPTTGPWDYELEFFPYRFTDNTVKGVYRAEENGLWIPGGHGDLFQQSHEFHLVLSGRMFSQLNVAGVSVSTQVYYLSFPNTGKLEYTVRFASGGTTLLRSVDAVFYGTGSNLRRAYSMTYIRTQVDFENDTFRVWVNGGEVAMEVISGQAISAWSPTYYSGTNPFGIGTFNLNNGGTQGTEAYFRDIHKAAVTDILTPSQAYDVANYLLS